MIEFLSPMWKFDARGVKFYWIQACFDVGNEGSKELFYKDITNLPLTERNINGDLKGGLRMNSTEGCLKNISGFEGSTKSVSMTKERPDICNYDLSVAKLICHANMINQRR